MRPELFGDLGVALITLFTGVYLTLRGYRRIGKKPGESVSYDLWYDRHGGQSKIAGLLMILVGLFTWTGGFNRIGKPPAPIPMNAWKRHVTSDGRASAEFPAPPKPNTESAQGIELNRLTLIFPDRDACYYLTFSDIPADTPAATEDELLDSLHDHVLEWGKQLGLKFVLVGEERITEDQIPGRKIEFAGGEKHSVKVKVFLVGTRMYQMIAVVPRSKADDEAAEKFLSSFRFEKIQP